MSTKLISKVYSCLISAQYFLLPGACILCKKPSLRNIDLCLACEKALPVIHFPCNHCALPLPSCESKIINCSSCLTFKPPFSMCISAFVYCQPIDHLVSNFKYQAKLPIGRVLSELLIKILISHYQHKALPDLIIPVPLHPQRLRQRGYNQAHEIAKNLSHALRIPIHTNLCSRTRNTQAQKNLSASKRHLNLQKAFSMTHNTLTLSGKSVAIVDDVVTTMATTVEITNLLLNNGAREVHVWSLARTCL